MNSLVVWTNGKINIRYSNKKYYLFDEEKPIIGDYDSLTPCNNIFLIASKKINSNYKYILLNSNGEKVFGNEKNFELISYNSELNKFTFYDYFKKIEIIFPKLSNEKNQLFQLFLNKIYNKNINEIDELQIVINEMCKRIENLSNEDIELIFKNLDLTNKLYIKLNRPTYLKNNLVVLTKEDEEELLNIINANKFLIFKELTKDIIKNAKIYELNKDLIENIISGEKISNLNLVLNGLNNICNKFKTQIEYYNKHRDEIFSNLESINKYYSNEESIKYFDDKDFEYIKQNRNLYLNIMFNEKNVNILNKLREYDIT